MFLCLSCCCKVSPLAKTCFYAFLVFSYYFYLIFSCSLGWIGGLPEMKSYQRRQVGFLCFDFDFYAFLWYYVQWIGFCVIDFRFLCFVDSMLNELSFYTSKSIPVVVRCVGANQWWRLVGWKTATARHDTAKDLYFVCFFVFLCLCV
jgi:hypothetical protein